MTSKASVVDPLAGANKTERAYGQRLELLRRAGEVLSWGFQRITLKLADDCRYTPDFDVVTAAGELEMHETKGFMRDDARVKLKVAARSFPFRFVLVKKTGADSFESEVVKP